jgi:hypothetical protein
MKDSDITFIYWRSLVNDVGKGLSSFSSKNWGGYKNRAMPGTGLRKPRKPQHV